MYDLPFASSSSSTETIGKEMFLRQKSERISAIGGKTTATKFGTGKAVNDLENLRNLNPKLVAGKAET